MKWLTELFGGKVLEDAGKVIDGLSTSNEEKSAAKNELSRIVLDSLNRLNDAQRDVLVAEIQGNKLQRTWRPVVMLTFAFIVAFHYFFYPIARAFNPELPDLPPLLDKFWTLLEIGIGGYVIGRSVEKTAVTVTKNVDVSFLRKKDRKKAMNDATVEEGEN